MKRHLRMTLRRQPDADKQRIDRMQDEGVHAAAMDEADAIR
jgi:hypothetical protein